MIARSPQLPDRAALDRARALLFDVAARRSRTGRWRADWTGSAPGGSLAAVVGTDWLPLAGRLSAGGGRVVRQHLRALGADPRRRVLTLGQVELKPVGSASRNLRAALPGRPGGDLWRAEVIDDADGRWRCDEGRDFVLLGAGGRPTLVLAEGGRLLNADGLTRGTRCRCSASPDEAPDRVGLAGAVATPAAVSCPRFGRVRRARCS